MTGPSSERTADAELRERVELCQAQVAESPYSHTVAANWYAVDVPALVSRNQQLQEALAAVPDGYERRVSDLLDRLLPPHTEDCDEAWTDQKCLRCDVFASLQVAYGFARPLASVRARTPA